ncbi:MAG TPA: hypothetical protein PKY82_01355, partial [Pyrinomonadaceae bacterium]|nr:hypothetical protein [Pyrinomonadaceae bacterium]
EGQKLLGMSVSFGDVTKPAELTVEENGQKKKVSYLPESQTKISVPQFKIKGSGDCLKSN